MVIDYFLTWIVDNLLLVGIVLFSIIVIVIVKLLQNRKFNNKLEVKKKMEETNKDVNKELKSETEKVQEDPRRINLTKDESVDVEPSRDEVFSFDVDVLREETQRKNRKDEDVFPSFNEGEVSKNAQFSGEETILRSIKSIGEVMAKENQSLDEAMKNDHESLNKELSSIKEKKELVKKYGLALGRLFEKYGEREEQLSLQINNIKRLLAPPREK